MKNIKFALKNSAVMALLITSFIACDKDFATVGSDIIGENNFDTDSYKYDVIAYTNPLEPVQTNNLPLNYLGVYNDPLYGLTTANFVTQVSSSIQDPDFGTNVVLDSVVLTVPYFSRRIEVNSEGTNVYELDSIFGSDPVNIEIFENEYFLSSFDPTAEFDTPLRYFSNMTTSNSAISTNLLEGTPILVESDMDPLTNVISNFEPSAEEIVLKNEEDEVTERLAPAMRIKLNNEFWQEKIIDKSQEDGALELSNANQFANYFRGLYFKVTPVNNNNGTLMLLNFGSTSSNITLYYSKDNPATEDEDTIQSTYVLSFNGNKVNFLDNQFNITIPEGNPTTGDEKLYLKGGQGATAVLDLFNSGTHEDGFSPEFLEFKNTYVETDAEGKFTKAKRLVNEANLVFYVDQSMVVGNEPNRIYLYDLTNGTPLLDYYLDVTNATVPLNSVTNHLGKLQREGNVPTGDGIKYKMKITEHINNLLLRDSTNVKLGLAVSTNVNLESTSAQYKVLTEDTDLVNEVPVSSILSPRGTILYGNNTTDASKKLQLEIFYTCIRTDENCDED